MEFTKDDAIHIYKTATPGIKAKLEKEFGRNVLTTKHFSDIQLFEDACADQNIAPAFAARVECMQEYLDETIALLKLKIIAKSIRGGWTPDFNNRNQIKWYPWFRWNGVGFGFDSSYTFYDSTGTDSGSRLCFETKEQSDFFGKQFIELWNVALVGSQK